MHVLASQIKSKFLRCKYFLVCNVLWSNFQDILKILTFFKETEFLKKYVSFNACKMWDQLYLYLKKKIRRYILKMNVAPQKDMVFFFNCRVTKI